MSTAEILKKKRLITFVPGAHEWSLAVQTQELPCYIRVMGMSCDCDSVPIPDSKCDNCMEEEGCLQIIGIFNADVERRSFLFWGLLARDKMHIHAEYRRLKNHLRVSHTSDMTQLVFGGLSPYKVDKGWIAPCPHSLLTLTRMFGETDRLERPAPTTLNMGAPDDGKKLNRYGLTEMEAKRLWDGLCGYWRRDLMREAVYDVLGESWECDHAENAVYEDMCEHLALTNIVEEVHRRLAGYARGHSKTTHVHIGNKVKIVIEVPDNHDYVLVCKKDGTLIGELRNVGDKVTDLPSPWTLRLVCIIGNGQTLEGEEKPKEFIIESDHEHIGWRYETGLFPTTGVRFIKILMSFE
ncbi:MAG: hypothetical protein ABIH21_01460 [Patescibacteria group bacterium]